MIAYIVRRLLLLAPMLFVISVVVFFLIQLPPGDFMSTFIANLEESGIRVSDAEAEIRGLRESTKADVEVLAAEVREYRKSTEAEIRGFREATDARLNAHDQMLARIERQIERMAADHRATVLWIVGSALALGGLIVAMLRFGHPGVG